jgi:hypothetical protein
LEAIDVILAPGNAGFGSHRMDVTRRVLTLLLLLGLADCSKGPEGADLTAECKAKVSAALQSKSLKQCVAACIECEHGVTTTCSTSCTLKGATVREGADAQ